MADPIGPKKIEALSFTDQETSLLAPFRIAWVSKQATVSLFLFNLLPALLEPYATKKSASAGRCPCRT